MLEIARRVLKITHPEAKKLKLNENLLILHLNTYQAVTTKSTTPFVIDFALGNPTNNAISNFRPLPRA